MEIDFVRPWHWLERFNIRPAGFSVEKADGGEYKPQFDKRFHASGHASREDITWLIDQGDPDHIVPIHTEASDWFDKSHEAVLIPSEAKEIKF
jgi:ribonuclease J